ncbi:hypothetical protein [Sorangium sp. So ce542]|uniref:hypothetical protein n=1 Tax=Sorangium sp. So ce542 TaxID=3133316 RepID=UPI003F6072CC
MNKIAHAEHSDDRARTAQPENLNRATSEQLLSFAMTGGSRSMNLAAALDAVVLELEPLYEALDSKGERWAAGPLHLLQCRLRVLAELARRRGATRGAAYQ